MNNLNAYIFENNGNLRSGWRAGIFLFAFIFVSVTIGTATLAVFATAGIESKAGSPIFLVVNGLTSLITALVIGWLCGKWLESLPFRALGASFTKSWLKHLIVGSAVGAFTLAFAVAIAFGFGGERFVLNVEAGTEAVARSLAVSLLVFAAASAFEEAFFRGYLLQTFERSGLAWLAILLTSLFFGAVHAGNPNAGVISTLNTILAGIWFSVAYLKTRDLWFVWGLHLMWNFTQGSIFGIEVSGLTEITANPLLKEIDTGPTWLTGTTYGIEGGIACTIALVISTVAIQYLPILKPDPELLQLSGKTNHIGT